MTNPSSEHWLPASPGELPSLIKGSEYEKFDRTWVGIVVDTVIFDDDMDRSVESKRFLSLAMASARNRYRKRIKELEKENATLKQAKAKKKTSKRRTR